MMSKRSNFPPLGDIQDSEDSGVGFIEISKKQSGIRMHFCSEEKDLAESSIIVQSAIYHVQCDRSADKLNTG